MKFAATKQNKAKVGSDDFSEKAQRRLESIRRKTDALNANRPDSESDTRIRRAKSPARPATSAATSASAARPKTCGSPKFNPGRRQSVKISEAKSSMLARCKEQALRNADRDPEVKRKSLEIEKLQAKADGGITRSTRQKAKQKIIKSVAEVADGLFTDGTALEKLHEVMSRAKESGMSVDAIFSHFHDGNTETNEVSREQFLEGLSQLGDDMFIAQEDEMEEIVRNFDYNNDGKISLSEFKSYCYYQIPSDVWVMERLRLEKSGGIHTITKDLKPDFDRRVGIDVYSCGEQVAKTTKLLWRIKANLDVYLFHCAELDVITIQTYETNSRQHLPNMYVMKGDCVIKRNDPESEGMNDWELIAKFIASRIKLNPSPLHKEGFKPYLCALSGDENKKFTISRPINITDPLPPEYPDPITREEFEEALDKVEQSRRGVRESLTRLDGYNENVQKTLADIQHMNISEGGH